jgi:predicted dienelactone hydrolase
VGPQRVTRRETLAAGLAVALLPDLARAAQLVQREIKLTVDGRSVRVALSYLPLCSRRPGFVALSHGANGTLAGLGGLIAGLHRGRVVAAPQHPDSEDNPELAQVDRATLPARRAAELRAVIDAIPEIEAALGLIAAAGRIDRSRISAAGHSFGALIAQALGGARMGGRDYRDLRVQRVVAFSPPGPIPGLCDAEGWSHIAVPHMVITGTADVLPVIAPTWEAHAASFEAARVPGSALWVGTDVDHYFGNLIQRLSRESPDESAALAEALRLADAFLDGAPLRPSHALTHAFQEVS